MSLMMEKQKPRKPRKPPPMNRFQGEWKHPRESVRAGGIPVTAIVALLALLLVPLPLLTAVLRVSWPPGVSTALAAPAVDPPRLARPYPLPIGMVTYLWGPTEDMLGLNDGLEKLGYQRDRDFILGVRSAEGVESNLQTIVQELSRYGAEVLYVSGIRELRAAQIAAGAMPIVFSALYDPRIPGIAPGNSSGISSVIPGLNGNITGVVHRFRQASPEGLAVLKSLVPGLRRVIVPYDARNGTPDKLLSQLRATSSRLGVEWVGKPLHTVPEARKAILAGIAGERGTGILPVGSGLNIPGFTLQAAIRHNVPAVFPRAWMAEYGGLASLGPSWRQMGLRAARLMGKILQGERASSLPLEIVEEMELVINMRAARRMGLKIAPEILARAQRVIQ